MTFEAAIEAARRELGGNADGILSLGRRKAIWTAGAALSDARTSYVRRVRLADACVRHVLDRWTERFADDDGVVRMLDLARDVVTGTTDGRTASAARDRFYVDVVDNRKYGSDASAMFVGLGAANTVLEALVVDTADAIPDEDDDEDLDPEAYDTSYMCASAAARGLNGRPADVERRRAFWRWYVDEAVPATYPS